MVVCFWCGYYIMPYNSVLRLYMVENALWSTTVLHNVGLTRKNMAAIHSHKLVFVKNYYRMENIYGFEKHIGVFW